jgi:hypothetical protein
VSRTTRQALCPEEEPLKTAQPGIASLHALLQLFML